MTATTTIVITTLTFFVKTILTKKLWFVKPEISLSALYHLYAGVFDNVDSPKDFCNIFSDSAHVIPFAMQNLRQMLCSIFLSIGKIAKHTWEKLTTSITVNKLNVPFFDTRAGKAFLEPWRETAKIIDFGSMVLLERLKLSIEE